MSEINKTKECDSTVWQAKIVSFKKINADFTVAEHNEECNSYPYLNTCQLKEGVDSIALKDKPESKGKVIYRIDNQHSLVKVKSVNSEWLYVAEYDESKKDMAGERQGYVEYRNIDPFN